MSLEKYGDHFGQLPPSPGKVRTLGKISLPQFRSAWRPLRVTFRGTRTTKRSCAAWANVSLYDRVAFKKKTQVGSPKTFAIVPLFLLCVCETPNVPLASVTLQECPSIALSSSSSSSVVVSWTRGQRVAAESMHTKSEQQRRRRLRIFE